jgi:hypothetical protein
MSEYLPLLNLLWLAVVPLLLRIEHRLTKLETKIENGFNCRKEG